MGTIVQIISDLKLYEFHSVFAYFDYHFCDVVDPLAPHVRRYLDLTDLFNS